MLGTTALAGSDFIRVNERIGHSPGKEHIPCTLSAASLVPITTPTSTSPRLPLNRATHPPWLAVRAKPAALPPVPRQQPPASRTSLPRPSTTPSRVSNNPAAHRTPVRPFRVQWTRSCKITASPRQRSSSKPQGKLKGRTIITIMAAGQGRAVAPTPRNNRPLRTPKVVR